MLLDDGGQVYMRWSHADNLGQAVAPYPVQAVVDRDGTIVYLAKTHDPGAVREAIDAALAD